MSYQLHIIYPGVPAGVTAILEAVVNKRGLNNYVSYDLAAMLRTHIRKASITRHKSAQRLGAQPTGHIENAAESTLPRATNAEAVVEINSPGFNRVDGPVTIRAKNWPYLTIPVNALSYGRRAATVRRLTGAPLFRPVVKGGKKRIGPFRNILAANINNTFTVLYCLKPSVVIPQDRGLLPETAATEARMVGSMGRYLRQRIKL